MFRHCCLGNNSVYMSSIALAQLRFSYGSMVDLGVLYCRARGTQEPQELVRHSCT